MLPSDFSKKPIAAGLLVALYGATALAQDAAVDADEVTSSEDLEEVLVTGIRYSIKRSMDLKRSDDGVMDAITAEIWVRSQTPTLPNLCSGLPVCRLSVSAAKVSTSPFADLVRPSTWCC